MRYVVLLLSLIGCNQRQETKGFVLRKCVVGQHVPAEILRVRDSYFEDIYVDRQYWSFSDGQPPNAGFGSGWVVIGRHDTVLAVKRYYNYGSESHIMDEYK